MRDALTTCICGGGSLAHALGAVLGSAGLNVNILTRRPQAWSRKLDLIYEDRRLTGSIHLVSSNPSDVVRDADIIIVAVPFFARHSTLESIKPYISPGAWVGAFPATGGFFWVASYVLGSAVTLFGTDRVPYVRETTAYGSEVLVTGIRKGLSLAANPSRRATEVAMFLSRLLSMPIEPVQSTLAVMLTPTNPVMHPARVYSIFSGYLKGHIFSRVPRFIQEWDELASFLFLSLDDELQTICTVLPVDLSCVKPLVRHYEILDRSYLTWRISSIAAQASRMAPMKPTSGGYIINLDSPYLSEDFPYGLAVLRAVGELAAVPTPTMDRLLRWYEDIADQQLFADGRLRGPDTKRLPLPWNYGIKGLDNLIEFCTR